MAALILIAITGFLILMWLVFSLVVMGHLIRYRAAEPGTWLIIIAYLLGSAVILTVIFALLFPLPWHDLIPYV